MGRVGADEFGRQMLAALQADRVRTDYVKISPATTSGIANITVDGKGENSIVVVPGANAKLTPADIDAAVPILSNAGCVLLQLETPLETIEHAIALCRKMNVFVILDPAPAPRQMSGSLFQVDLLTPNQTEAIAIPSNTIISYTLESVFCMPH